MNIIIFGAGKVYTNYKQYICHFHIICMTDNDKQKHGKKVDGIKVFPPQEVAFEECDFVIIMTDYYREIQKQLLDMNVPEKKIIPYIRIGEIIDHDLEIYSGVTRLGVKKWLLDNANTNRKKIMLISPNFAYAGVPVAMLNMAKVLKNMKYNIVIIGVGKGGLVKEIQEAEIDHISGIDIFYGGEQFLKFASEFDLIIVSSIILSNLIMEINRINVPILWWIHESDSMYYKKIFMVELGNNVHLYACAERVLVALQKYIGNVKIGKLYYSIRRKKEIQIFSQKSKAKVVFGVIGTMCKRKGQDILVEAIQSLPEVYRGKFEVLVIGNTIDVDDLYWNPVEKKLLQMSEVTITGELSQEQIEKYYGIMDVIICPSRDDPMPIVVTEAMMHEKVCIVSENVGQAEFIQEGVNGFIFHNEKVEELAEKMIWVLDHKDELPAIGNMARQIYKDRFTEEAMQKRMKEIMDDLDV